MGRNKCVMEKIEDPTSRQRTYSKCKDSFVKKAKALATLCDTDVAFLMFSPTGQVTSYSSRGRYYEPQVENISSVQEADAYQKFLTSAMEQIQRSQERLLGCEGFVQGIENVVVASVNTADTTYAADMPPRGFDVQVSTTVLTGDNFERGVPITLFFEAIRIGQFMRLHPPMFTGTKVEEDSRDFIDEMEKILCIMHAS
ncbi:hypothetical protein T459_19679 [Capsicum annuum]|uniref:MADS-box domain-containing protein n=1 Tax=Capsicum annuum TaxID=4072 RepID=A0A2G2Z2B5_CAPAN|nr:hypothetical protein T459_19679 [Capsicum annuum]